MLGIIKKIYKFLVETIIHYFYTKNNYFNNFLKTKRKKREIKRKYVDKIKQNKTQTKKKNN